MRTKRVRVCACIVLMSLILSLDRDSAHPSPFFPGMRPDQLQRPYVRLPRAHACVSMYALHACSGQVYPGGRCRIQHPQSDGCTTARLCGVLWKHPGDTRHQYHHIQSSKGASIVQLSAARQVVTMRKRAAVLVRHWHRVRCLRRSTARTKIHACTQTFRRGTSRPLVQDACKPHLVLLGVRHADKKPPQLNMHRAVQPSYGGRTSFFGTVIRADHTVPMRALPRSHPTSTFMSEDEPGPWGVYL